MSYIKYLVVILWLGLLPINPLMAAEQLRKVVVLPFSFHYVSEDVGDVDVGAELAKVISKKIAKMPGWAPIDQDDVSAILQREDSADLSGTQIGRLLGADAIITGQVQAFQFDMNPDTSAAALTVADTAASAASYVPTVSSVPYVGGLAGLASSLFSSASSVSSSSPRGHANVVVDAKLIDVYSGKELAILSGTAKSRKGATNLWGSGGPNSDFLSNSFANCIAGQATFAAVDEICKQLVDTEPKVDALAGNHVQGLVMDVDDDLICVGVGKAGGFKVGDRFIVERDPAKASDNASLRVGAIILTDIGDHSSLAKLVDGKDPIFAGDTIRGEKEISLK